MRDIHNHYEVVRAPAAAPDPANVVQSIDLAAFGAEALEFIVDGPGVTLAESDDGVVFRAVEPKDMLGPTYRAGDDLTCVGYIGGCRFVALIAPEQRAGYAVLGHQRRRGGPMV